MATMERKQQLMSGALEELREKLFQEAKVFDDRISAEEAELFEKSVAMEELLTERERTNAEEWRVSDAVRGDVTWKAASGAQRSRAGALSFRLVWG